VRSKTRAQLSHDEFVRLARIKGSRPGVIHLLIRMIIREKKQ